MVDLSYIIQDMTTFRKNRFNGDVAALSSEEAEIHDRIFINELKATEEDDKFGYGTSKLWDKVRADLNWFRKNNAKAYMILLD
jgi:hypothetical protein